LKKTDAWVLEKGCPAPKPLMIQCHDEREDRNQLANEEPGVARKRADDYFAAVFSKQAKGVNKKVVGVLITIKK